MPDLLNDFSSSQPARVAIVGAGMVGSSFAYALLLSGLASEIVLIDANTARAEGEAMDLSHALPFTPAARVWAGTYADCAGAAITVVAAGAAQKPGETRLDLAQKNSAIFKQIIAQMQSAGALHPNGDDILLVATNPVDVLTFASQQFSKLAPNRVLGSGTILDTARFRYLLGHHCGVDSHSVHSYIIGEHGDSEVPVWSLANIGGMPLDEYCEAYKIAFGPAERDEIYRATRDAAYEIISRKGATYYAVGAGLMRIVEAILRNQSTVLSVSSLQRGIYGLPEVCLSLPTVVNRRGAQRVLPLPLSDVEREGLLQSASVLRESIEGISL